MLAVAVRVACTTIIKDMYHPWSQQIHKDAVNGESMRHLITPHLYILINLSRHTVDNRRLWTMNMHHLTQLIRRIYLTDGRITVVRRHLLAVISAMRRGT